MSFSLIVLQLEKILQYPHGVVYIGEVILYIINLMIKVLLVIFILVISASCKRSPSDLSFKSKDDLVRRNQLATGEAPLNFNSLQKYILKPKCMSCHSGPDAKPNNDPIDFTTYDSTMVDRFIPLLVKGKPQKSRLKHSLISIQPKKLFRTLSSRNWPKSGSRSSSYYNCIQTQ